MSDLMELVDACETMPPVTKKADVSSLFTKAQELESLGLVKAAQEILAVAQKELRPNLVAGFIRITTSDIEKYLEKKVEKYDKKQNKAENAFAETSRVLSAIGGIVGLSGLMGNAGNAYWVNRSTVAPHSASLGVEGARHQVLESYMDAIRRMNPAQYYGLTDQWAGSISRRTCDYYSSEEGKIGQFVWEESDVKEYTGIPPQKVLDRLKQVREMKIFDYFTIASVKGIKDPIVLGRFNDDNDNRYFVDQWGDDVKIEELM